MAGSVKVKRHTRSLNGSSTKVIEGMLKENTGCNMLDSGGAYGRNWERNQKRQFSKESQWKYSKDEVPTQSTYYFLKDNLVVTPKAKKWQEVYDKRYKNSKNAYLEDMEDFIDYLTESGQTASDNYLVAGKPGVTNTYNYDNTLDQTLQYIIWYDGSEYFIILQVHGGCDVRGGYTAPKIFQFTDEADSFVLKQTDINVVTKKDNYYTSDDAGAHWYKDGSTADGDFEWSDVYSEGIKGVS